MMYKTLDEKLAELPLERQTKIQEMTDKLVAEENARRKARQAKRRTRVRSSAKRLDAIHPHPPTP